MISGVTIVSGLLMRKHAPRTYIIGASRHLREHPAARTLLDLSRVPYRDAAAREMIEKIKTECKAPRAAPRST